MLLEGKTAIIYGGSGAIGSATAGVFAREGARVHLVGQTEERLRRTAEAIEARGGSAAYAVVDAFDADAVRAHADAVAADDGHIDIAMNVVGVPHVQGVPLADLPVEDFLLPVERYARTNVVTAKAVAGHMQARRSGVILTISAPGSQLPGIGHLGNAAACGAVEAFSRVLAGELGPDGVRVVCLRPHAIPESIATSHLGAVFTSAAARVGTDAPGWLAGLAEHGTLLGRLPTLEDVAEYAAFVASDRARAMTGAIANLTCGALVD
ncbi:SDR family NAD(P)-dependent oxidoreductase [Georgenia faecalis]|uniref:SDR family NAD(P)-dependent oxidoreductase n=1 Tax=Georgenia faecalis TaxID=2483799 RepID=A0ABV9D5L8_9MICO|nr:SDR family oxidoreductase [Georgenia faecalis]